MRDAVRGAPVDVSIDLGMIDDGPAESTAVPWRRLRRLMSVRVPVPAVVALVLVGVVAGALATYQWMAVQQRSREASEVSLVLAAAGIESVGGEPGRITIEGAVTAVNGGPMPVEVSGAADAAAVMVKGQRRIAPAATGWFAVTATVPCSDGAGVRPLPVDLSVVTADGARRAVTVQLPLMGSQWYELVVRVCSMPR
ncbi:hypothetical protein ABT297_00040 [Dactylosporangium sp. NPDC000555]|uniref:hypothetical protein n=1 Tax=Dactylosporangium sp. NPDC000555 TaxID=3154260 RepID=UPI00332776C0